MAEQFGENLWQLKCDILQARSEFLLRTADHGWTGSATGILDLEKYQEVGHYPRLAFPFSMSLH